MKAFARNWSSGKLVRHSGGVRGAWPLAIALGWLAMAAVCPGASFQDLFANRETVTNTTGQLAGNNSNATVEASEPLITGKPGGHSLWISWVAPTNGVATFHTDGSTFDTLLAAYYFGSTNDTNLGQLHLAAGNDDFPGIAPASQIQIGALAGQHYEISVDGYHGAVGDILLKWSFISASSPPPIIVSVPNNQAARQGDPVSLTVNMQTSPNIQLQWQLDEVDVTDAKGTNLFIPSLQPTNVGRYSLRVSIGAVRFFTMPTEIQINSEGQTNALAEDKLLDSPGSPLIGEDGHGTNLHSFLRSGAPLIGVVRGYNGSQIFDTTYATTDPNEPPHCGVTGGSSYWLAYQPPTNGTATLDTIGSTYDTVIEAYTYNGTLTSYQDLISLACDNDSVAPQGASRIRFPVVKTRQYLVVVDGVNGARGTAWLNYNLDTNTPPTAPALLSPPAAVVAVPGTSVTLSPNLAGSPPLQYAWKKNQTPMSGANSRSLVLPNVTTADSADYTLAVTNDLGSLTVTVTLHVVVPPRCSLARIPAGVELSWPTVAGQRYTIQEAAALTGPWLAWTNLFVGDGQTTVIDVAATDTRFYRIRVE